MKLNDNINLRLPVDLRQKLADKAYPFRYTDVLRELIQAYVDNRVTIEPINKEQ